MKREQFWMDYTKCYERDIGFNNTRKSDRPLGYKHTEESKQKMSLLKRNKPMHPNTKEALKNRKNTKHSDESKLKISLSKRGDKNPNWNKKEDEEKKKIRMANMLATPRWNKGKKIGDDTRLEKLRSRIGKTPPNVIKCKIVDTEENLVFEGSSLKDLSNKSPLSLASINRLKNGNCGKKITNRYKFYECRID